jgi:hypothetical protein
MVVIQFAMNKIEIYLFLHIIAITYNYINLYNMQSDTNNKNKLLDAILSIQNKIIKLENENNILKRKIECLESGTIWFGECDGSHKITKNIDDKCISIDYIKLMHKNRMKYINSLFNLDKLTIYARSFEYSSDCCENKCITCNTKQKIFCDKWKNSNVSKIIIHVSENKNIEHSKLFELTNFPNLTHLEINYSRNKHIDINIIFNVIKSYRHKIKTVTINGIEYDASYYCN